MNNPKADEAKRLLRHYLLECDRDKAARDPDCFSEVDYIVDLILSAAVKEVKAEIMNNGKLRELILGIVGAGQ